MRKTVLLAIFILLLSACGKRQDAVQLPSLPGAGLSGHYAAQIGESLYVAGGCNFPDEALTEGGRKRFYDDILVLGADGWSVAGHLPQPSAYAAYIATDEGLLIMGGANSSGSVGCVWLFDGSTVKELPALPKALEQMAWCSDDSTIYLAGGLSDGTPSLDVFALEDGRWSVKAELPAPVVQGIATLSDGRLNVWGGYDPAGKEALTGGYALGLSTVEWSALDAGVTFVGSAPLGNYAAGGCDADVFTSALRLPPEDVLEYQSQPSGYYRFRGELLEYADGTWTDVAQSPHLARAGAALAAYNGALVSIGGELKPGVRSPEVWIINLERK